ncbi:MAG: type II toxin-antitoxin system HicB family antitoxin [Dehalococcoidia bacterium]|nr:type II toxin-antitoxin system HicB family antitoxin [Dehalococcoidia bacterium]
MAQQNVHVVLWKECDQWVAWCLEYDVASQGDSEDHAMAMIQEAVELHIEDMSQEELERVFIPVDSTPVVRETIVRATAILKR